MASFVRCALEDRCDTGAPWPVIGLGVFFVLVLAFFLVQRLRDRDR